MSNVILLAGLGFGDEGKGTMVDYLAHTEAAALVVRYNGGAQSAHNVVTNSGHHHTFAQFGSGMFAGADTHLSRFMLVNPFSLANEALALKGMGFAPFDHLTVEREALVTTPFHIEANRLREFQRGEARHGSCGFGIGETVADFLRYPEMAVRVADLSDPEALRKKLRFSRELKAAEFAELQSPHWIAYDDDQTETHVARYAAIAHQLKIVDRDYLPAKLKERGTVIFEGAQGVLLDQDYGFHPHTTWSDITFGNAHKLLEGYDGLVRKIGVLRGYMTRHGAGPFPTELNANNPLEIGIDGDQHNKWGQFQESFRLGHFDAVLARYALEVIGVVDELAITNLDKLPRKPVICTAYTNPGWSRSEIRRIMPEKLDPSVLEHGSELTRSLFEMKPIYEELPDRPSIVDRIAQELNTPVTLCSVGPKTEHKWPTRYLRSILIQSQQNAFPDNSQG